jgi:ferredoxin
MIPTIVAAEKRGLMRLDNKKLEVSGVSLDEIEVEPFALPSSISINFVGGRVPKFLESFVTNTFRPQPVFDHDKCVGCEDCKRSCPPNIIKMVDGKPVPDLDKCIRCFCCHELCPIKAVDIKKHWLHEKLFG